jgi:hypothetical protein
MDPDAIYIVRIIDPPNGEQSRKSTIYISAKGSKTYIIDSVSIVHISGIYQTIFDASGSPKPDADYVFPYRYRSSETYPMNPALVINPNDNHEISFTLGLYPQGIFNSIGGHVQVTLNYHIENSNVCGILELVTTAK